MMHSCYSLLTVVVLGTANALILVNTLRILRPFLEGSLTASTTSMEKKSKDMDKGSGSAAAKQKILKELLQQL